MVDPSDIQLVARIQAGEDKAEIELLKRFGPRISRKVAYRLGSGNEDWKDVAADAQMALLLSLRQGKFDVDRGVSLGAYVYGITLNKIRDYFKNKKRRPIISDNLPESIVTIGEAYDLERKERRTHLNRLLGSLALKYKEVLYLRFYQELSISEISQTINLSPRRVSERIHYALKLLRKKCCNKKDLSIFSGFILTIY